MAAVLLTVKLILWADKNGIVSALMQPPWKWFDLDKVRDEFNERQEHKKKPTGINQNGTAHLNGAGAALTTT